MPGLLAGWKIDEALRLLDQHPQRGAPAWAVAKLRLQTQAAREGVITVALDTPEGEPLPEIPACMRAAA